MCKNKSYTDKENPLIFGESRREGKVDACTGVERSYLLTDEESDSYLPLRGEDFYGGI